MDADGDVANAAVVRTISLLRHTRCSEGLMRERWSDERLDAALDFVTLVWTAIAVVLLVDLLF